MHDSRLDRLLQSAAAEKVFTAAQVVVYRRGALIANRAFGRAGQGASASHCEASTRFDLSSLTKVFVAIAFMSFVEALQVDLDDPVGTVLPEFTGSRNIGPYPDPRDHDRLLVPSFPASVTSASEVTFRHLLNHTSGLPPYLPIWREALPITDPNERDEFFFQTIYGSAFAYPVASRVLYSDLGFLLLGKAVERLANSKLGRALNTTVTGPLGLDSIEYGPLACVDVAATEYYRWCGRRLCGEVHDENALVLRSPAGHAGLFGSCTDVASLGEALRNCLTGRSNTPLHRTVLTEMVSVQAVEDVTRRGLAFALWSPSVQSASHPFSRVAFGHLGFTGTSLWVDPAQDLVIACLTNHVYFGRHRRLALQRFRLELANLFRADESDCKAHRPKPPLEKD